MQNRLKRVGFVFCFPKKTIFADTNAGIAQLVEHQLPKLRVASSSLVTRSKGEESLLSDDCKDFLLNYANTMPIKTLLVNALRKSNTTNPPLTKNAQP